MKPKFKILPKFKPGDWVRLNPESPRYAQYLPDLSGKIVKIRRMSYHECFEENPSPWEIHFAGLRLQDEARIFEEDVILDPFMTAAHRAVDKNDGESIHKETKNAT